MPEDFKLLPTPPSPGHTYEADERNHELVEQGNLNEETPIGYRGAVRKNHYSGGKIAKHARAAQRLVQDTANANPHAGLPSACAATKQMKSETQPKAAVGDGVVKGMVKVEGGTYQRGFMQS